MKTGILMAMADDRRTGKPLTEVLPYDEAVKEFKRRVEAQEAPEGFPNLEIWTGKVKSRRIKSAASPQTQHSPEPGESTPDSPTEPEALLLEEEPAADTSAAEDGADEEETVPIVPASPGSMSPKGKRRR